MTKKSADAASENTLQMSLAPKRLFNRREAAQYMGRCPKTFDKIRHKFAVDDNGLVRYDRVLMDKFATSHGQSPVRSFRVPQEIR